MEGGSLAVCTGMAHGYGGLGERIVNKGFTTALAVKAIEGTGLLYKL